MKESCSSGRCVLPADGGRRWRLSGALLWLALAYLGALAGPVAVAAEAPPPLPPEAEAAHQDLQGKPGAARSKAEESLDEAIFTEISPLTIPETGIALPADQEH